MHTEEHSDQTRQNTFAYELARAERDIVSYVQEKLAEEQRLRRKNNNYRRELRRLLTAQRNLKELNSQLYETLDAQSVSESETVEHNRTLLRVLDHVIASSG